jgi:hypothetical protein
MLAYAEANVDFGIAYAEMGPNRTLVQSIFQIRSEQESVKKQNEIQKKLFSVKGQKKKKIENEQRKRQQFWVMSLGKDMYLTLQGNIELLSGRQGNL